MTKLDWAKAKQRSFAAATAAERRLTRRQSGQRSRQHALAAFTTKHHLSCFKCGDAHPSAWAKTGTNKQGQWAICAPCANKNPSG
ncbi:MAG: hypothetical protein ACRDHF_17795 [Tepidiformaceae bacterium]